MNKSLQFIKVVIIVFLTLITADTYAFFGKSKKNTDKEKAIMSQPVADTQDVINPDSLSVPNVGDDINVSGNTEELYQAFLRNVLEKEIDTIPVDTGLIVPEEFEYLYDKLLNTWMIHQSEKPGCSGNSSLVHTPDSTFRIRLALLPHVIEMPYNNVVRSMLDVYLVKKTSQLEYMLGVSDYYFPIFEEELAKQNLPLELKYLPVIESGLNPNAVSHMGAAGLWQFMISTGRLYGLEINSLVDERLDPIKSTKAAVRFLKDLYDIYGDWNLAIAGYNCGPGNVNKAIRRAGGQRDFWKIYPHLPRETRGYVPIFIAANYAMSYAQDHNICPAIVQMPVLADTIMVTERIHFEQISNILNVPVEQIRMLNPQYRRDVIPGDIKPYGLCLPLDYATAYIDKCDDIASYKADELINNRRKEVDVYRAAAPGGSGKLVYHKVRSGDTLSGIASRYGVSVNKLRSWNNISGSRINAGQSLKIYK